MVRGLAALCTSLKCEKEAVDYSAICSGGNPESSAHAPQSRHAESSCDSLQYTTWTTQTPSRRNALDSGRRVRILPSVLFAYARSRICPFAGSACSQKYSAARRSISSSRVSSAGQKSPASPAPTRATQEVLAVAAAAPASNCKANRRVIPECGTVGSILDVRHAGAICAPAQALRA